MKLSQLALERSDMMPCAVHSAESIVLNGRNVTSRVCAILSTMSLGRFDLALPHLEWIAKNALEDVPNPDEFWALLTECRRHAKT